MQGRPSKKNFPCKSYMKTCSYCGRENDDAAVQCRECGTPFPSGSPDEFAMNQCLKCKSANVITGKLADPTCDSMFAPVFKPDRKLRFLAWTLKGGTRCNEGAYACLDCGLVWTSLSAQELKDFITRCCKKPKPDPNEASPG